MKRPPPRVDTDLPSLDVPADLVRRRIPRAEPVRRVRQTARAIPSSRPAPSRTCRWTVLRPGRVRPAGRQALFRSGRLPLLDPWTPSHASAPELGPIDDDARHLGELSVLRLFSALE